MLLKDIVEEIAEKSLLTIGEQSIIRKVNVVQREIFRKVKVETISRWDLEADQAGYPVSIPKGDIILVLADGVEYPYLALTASEKSRYYTYVDGSVILHPSPEKTVSEGLNIFHYKRPTELTVGDMEKEPDLDPDFHMLLVYGALKEISEEEKFTLQYNRLFREYAGSHHDPGMLVVKVGDLRR